jgi:hypothetical protein
MPDGQLTASCFLDRRSSRSKSRLNFLSLLRAGCDDCVINDATLAYLRAQPVAGLRSPDEVLLVMSGSAEQDELGVGRGPGGSLWCYDGLRCHYRSPACSQKPAGIGSLGLAAGQDTPITARHTAEVRPQGRNMGSSFWLVPKARSVRPGGANAGLWRLANQSPGVGQL